MDSTTSLLGTEVSRGGAASSVAQGKPPGRVTRTKVRKSDWGFTTQTPIGKKDIPGRVDPLEMPQPREIVTFGRTAAWSEKGVVQKRPKRSSGTHCERFWMLGQGFKPDPEGNGEPQRLLSRVTHVL